MNISVIHKNLLKAGLIMTIINLLSTWFLGNYLEAYESISSAFISGTYTEPTLRDWDIDVQFLFTSVYTAVNKLFPHVQFYALLLVFFTWVSLYVIGYALYQALLFFRVRYPLFVFGFLYALLAPDQLLNIATNRIVLFTFAGLLLQYELCRLTGENLTLWFKLMAGILFVWICQMRFEMVLLCSGFYLAILWAFKKIHIRAWLPLFYSLAIFALYITLISCCTTEGRKTFFFKEKQFLDRKDIRQDHLSAMQELDIKAFMDYQFMDEEHFTRKFYDDLSEPGNRVTDLQLVKGVGSRSFSAAFRSTFPKAMDIWFLLAGNLLMFGGILFFARLNKTRLIISFAFLFLFPALLSFYVMVPSRFIVPYYALFFVLNSLVVLGNKPGAAQWLLPVFAGMVLFKLRVTVPDSRNYKAAEQLYTRTMNNIDRLFQDSKTKNKIVVANLEPAKFLPASPYAAVVKRDVLFLNYYYFAVYHGYLEGWYKACKCNALSLRSKTDYVVANNCRLVISDESLDFFKLYMQKKYKLELQAEKPEPFDNDLNIYRISYAGH